LPNATIKYLCAVVGESGLGQERDGAVDHAADAESGSGKSKIEGSIKLGGTDLLSLPDAQMRRSAATTSR
jgi:hypothetical protein